MLQTGPVSGLQVDQGERRASCSATDSRRNQRRTRRKLSITIPITTLLEKQTARGSHPEKGCTFPQVRSHTTQTGIVPTSKKIPAASAWPLFVNGQCATRSECYRILKHTQICRSTRCCAHNRVSLPSTVWMFGCFTVDDSAQATFLCLRLGQSCSRIRVLLSSMRGKKGPKPRRSTNVLSPCANSLWRAFRLRRDQKRKTKDPPSERDSYIVHMGVLSKK